jgi:hypothetical protein
MIVASSCNACGDGVALSFPGDDAAWQREAWGLRCCAPSSAPRTADGDCATPGRGLLPGVRTSFLAAVPASAITNGQPDGNAHPNVGVMVIHFGISAPQRLYSGELIARRSS